MARKERNEPFTRGKSKRADYEKVLIVCEGEKTEPNYFNDIKDSFGINSANIKIIGKGGTPMNIINLAKEICEKEPRHDPFDRVFCVFDYDEHDDYQNAVNYCGRFTNDCGRFVAINSVPCFEYWLLLHFRFTTTSYGKAKEVEIELKRYIRNYRKGEIGIYKKLESKTEEAKGHAKKALTAAKNAGTENPSTRVHILVDILQNIKNP